MRKQTIRFRIKDQDGRVEHHTVDVGGNHFVGKRCVNPKYSPFVGENDLEIGSTYDPSKRCQGIVERTGSIFDDQDSFVYLDQELRTTVKVIRTKGGKILKTAL